MGRDMSKREGPADIVLDSLSPVVPILHRPVSRHQDVQRHERTSTRLASAQRVKIEPLLAVSGEQRLDLLELFGGE